MTKSGSIQLVISKSKVPNHEEIGQLLQGSTFVVEGVLGDSELHNIKLIKGE